MNKCDRIISDKNCNIIVQNDEINENCVLVYILQYHSIDGESNSSLVLVKYSQEDKILFPTKYDGYYTLISLNVPTDITKPYYYFNNKFFKGTLEIELLEILETNPSATQIEVFFEDYFLTCRLRNCYINISKKILDKRVSVECENNVDRNSIYKRDLIWSTINVILYLVDFCLYKEASRILAKVGGCNGICEEIKNENCGCM